MEFLIERDPAQKVCACVWLNDGFVASKWRQTRGLSMHENGVAGGAGELYGCRWLIDIPFAYASGGLFILSVSCSSDLHVLGLVWLARILKWSVG